MQLVEQYSATQPPIDAVGEGWLQIAGKRWQQSLMLAPDQIQAWDCDSWSELAIGAFDPALQFKPEVLLLATGPQLRFPAPELRMALQQQGLGLEVMDHHGAARTYNLLVSEGRRVVALFLIEAGD